MSEENTNNPDNTGDESGSDTPSFIDTLGDDYKSNELFEGVEDAKGLATKFVETNDKVAELNQQVQELQKEIPESADGYELNLPENLSEMDAKNFDDFKALSHDVKLTNEQAQKITEFELKLREEAMSKYEEVKETAKDELVKEFGEKYDAKLDEVKSILKKYGGEEMLADIEIDNPEGGLLNHPSFFKLLSNIAGAMSPDSIGDTNKGGVPKEEKPFHERLYGKQ